MDERLHDRDRIVRREQLEPFGIRCARGSGVEDAAAAERRPVAEDDTVAAGRDDRVGETELGEPISHADEPRRRLGRPVVHAHARVIPDRLQLGELHVEPVAERIGAGLDERIAALEDMALDARDRERDALAGFGALDRLVVDLHAPNANIGAGRLGPQLVALRDRARPERSRHDRPDPVQREDAVDVVASRRKRGRVLLALGHGGEGAAQLVEAVAGLRAHGDDFCVSARARAPRP